MELTQAQRIFLDTMNATAERLGNQKLSKETLLDYCENDDNETAAFTQSLLKAMDTYARAKWVQACNEMWNSVNEAMGDQTVDNSIKICSVKHPEFKP